MELLGNVSALQFPHGIDFSRHKSKLGHQPQIPLSTFGSWHVAFEVSKHVHGELVEVQVFKPLHHLQTLGGADVQSCSGDTSSSEAAFGLVS